MVAKRVVDGNILRLIKLFLKSGVMEGNDRWTDDKGTPQGGVISPLLANIYLNNIDKGWKPLSNSARLIRYCDDLVIMTKYHSDLKVNQNSIAKARLFSIAATPYHPLPF
jgi:retron-type reverse transcriptase